MPLIRDWRTALEKSTTTLAAELGKFLRAFTPQSLDHTIDFTSLAHKAIAARPQYVRSKNYYISEVLSPYSCTRRMAFMRAEGCWVDRQAEDPKDILRMDVGTVTHQYVQDQLLGPSGGLFGNWKCAACGCGRVENNFYPRGQYCDNHVIDEEYRQTAQDPEDAYIPCKDRQKYLEKRGKAAWLYDEIKVYHDDLKLAGRVDGILVNQSEWVYDNMSASWYTVELKSVDDLTFHDLMTVKLTDRKYPELAKLYPDLVGKEIVVESRFKLPKPGHFNQAGIYSELLKLYCDDEKLPLNRDKYSGTLVVYVNTKNYDMRSFFRVNSSSLLEAAKARISVIEHIVDQTDQVKRDTEEEDLERIEENRKVIKQLPKSCSKRTDRSALQCPWRLICFPYKDTSKNKVEILK